MAADDKKIIFSMVGVSKAFQPNKNVLKDIYLSFFYGAKIGIIGLNGSGKSTLLKILAGVREPSRGKVSAPKDTVIAYLPQHLMTEDGRTVFEETAQAFAHLHEMEAEIAELNKQLETRTDYESDSYMELIERVSTLSEKFYSIEEINYDADIEKTLLGLGFKREDFDRQTSEFSGGWRMRIELAKLLFVGGADESLGYRVYPVVGGFLDR